MIEPWSTGWRSSFFSFPKKSTINANIRRCFFLSFFTSANEEGCSFTSSALRVVLYFVPALERAGNKNRAGFGELDYG